MRANNSIDRKDTSYVVAFLGCFEPAKYLVLRKSLTVDAELCSYLLTSV